MMSQAAAKPGTFHRYSVGAAEVVVLADGFRSFPLPDNFVVNAEPAEVRAALVAAGMPPDKMTIHFNPVLVITNGMRVLIDTGNGPQAAKAPDSTTGHLQSCLAGAAIDPGSIDLVVISHFHGDHVNGLLSLEEEPAFPNAEIAVPEREWDFWMDDDEMNRTPEGRLKDAFEQSRWIFHPLQDRVRRYAWQTEVAPGLIAEGTPGHTPGHTSFVLSSNSESLFIQSDVTNNPALFARHPGWHAFFDMDGDAAEATRRRVYDMLVGERMQVQGFHYPFPGRATVEADGNGYRVVPV